MDIRRRIKGKNGIGSNQNVFNSERASQFTIKDFTEMLEAAGVGISMDGRDRVYDNIFIERLWCTVKYEGVYLHDYQCLSGK